MKQIFEEGDKVVVNEKNLKKELQLVEGGEDEAKTIQKLLQFKGKTGVIKTVIEDDDDWWVETVKFGTKTINGVMWGHYFKRK